jgi:membrane protease YdiL (CAAX protease family)
LPPVLTANVAVGKHWAGQATGILAGGTAGITFLVGLGLVVGLIRLVPGAQPLGLGGGVIATAVVAAALASRPMREGLARVVPIDPDSPVHAYALVLAVILFGAQLATIFFVDNLALDRSLPPLTLADVAASETPFLIMAVAGVGFYIRRDASSALQRLGLTRPAWWQISIAFACAGAFFAFGLGANALSNDWTPQVASQVHKTLQHIYGGLGDPLGIVALALLPGICEEILFRGALQPRIGLLATALLFTSIHTQYGLSLDVLAVLVLAIGLGLIRKYTNTTTSVVCHASYNLLVGAGIATSLVGVAIGAEMTLVAVSGYAVWSRRRPTTLVVP